MSLGTPRSMTNNPRTWPEGKKDAKPWRSEPKVDGPCETWWKRAWWPPWHQCRWELAPPRNEP